MCTEIGSMSKCSKKLIRLAESSHCQVLKNNVRTGEEQNLSKLNTLHTYRVKSVMHPTLQHGITINSF